MTYSWNPGITDEQMEELRKKTIEEPDITLKELKEQLQLPISISALCRIISNKLKLRHKKTLTGFLYTFLFHARKFIAHLLSVW